MSQAMRFGIIGSGMMGREHIRNLAITPRAKVVALADPEPDSLARARKTLGEAGNDVAAFATVEAMIAGAELDAVIVCSPNFTHRAVLEPLFASKLHILCEKPLCTTLEDARWAAEKALSHPAVFWTGMEYRYMPPAARFIEEIQGGKVGRLVRSRSASTDSPSFPRSATGTGSAATPAGPWSRSAATSST